MAWHAVAACALVLGAIGCAPSGSSPPGSTPARPSAPSAHDADVERFGEPVPEGRAVTLERVLADPEGHTTDALLLEGHVRRVCQRRGCWMELTPGPDHETPACRVTFRDYGFFVPTDAHGAHARLQGRIAIDTIPAEHVAHLEEEGAHFAHKTDDGTAREVRVVATGVELRR